MKEIFINKMKGNHIIAAVKDIKELDTALKSECDIIFLLCGSIFNLGECVEKAHKSNKLIFLHVDLIEGFSRDTTALKYISKNIKPDGIISTKNSQLKSAKSLGMLTVQRVFIIDSLSIDTAVKSTLSISPDAVEIMPGIMPKITCKISQSLDIPVIVGGLIDSVEEVKDAVSSGALGVSASSSDLWRIKL